MFFVFNKQKIYTYAVSLVTVIVLFFVASNFGQENQKTVETSAENQKLLPIYNVQTEENKVAFTMNCAWNADDIDSILETLQKNNIKITFFMVGDWIEKFPEAVKKIKDAGHEIASHSDTHPHVNNNTVIKATRDKGYFCIQWNLDTLDYTGITGDEMWNRLKEKIKAGDIILSHNGTKHTADSLDMIIKNIKAKGLEVVRISDLIYQENYTINNNGTQIKSK